MKLHGLCTLFLRGRAWFVWNDQHLTLQENALAIYFENLEPLAALANQVHATVRILFRYGDDFGSAADLRNAFVQGSYYSEGRFRGQTFPDHFLVARLEDMQWQRRTRKQDELQGKQGKKRHKISSAIRTRQCDSTTLCRGDLDFGSSDKYNASMELHGKVVVVTGASMGIGEAIAKIFAEQGASVVLLSRDSSRAEAARDRIGFLERTAAFSCDIRHSEEIDRVLALTLHHFQRIDVWINNAGHGLLDSVSQMDMPACREMFETNFFGAVIATQKVIPIMTQQGGGTIINISSVAGHIPLPFHAAYSATKFALNAMGKAARVEWKKHAIHVLTVCPGYVRTAFAENAARGHELKKVRPNSVRGVSPERVARATLRGYLKHKREVIVPWTMHIPVKLYQLFPGLVERAMGGMAK